MPFSYYWTVDAFIPIFKLMSSTVCFLTICRNSLSLSIFPDAVWGRPDLSWSIQLCEGRFWVRWNTHIYWVSSLLFTRRCRWSWQLYLILFYPSNHSKISSTVVILTSLRQLFSTSVDAISHPIPCRHIKQNVAIALCQNLNWIWRLKYYLWALSL